MKRPMVFVFFYLAVGILMGRYMADALYPLLLGMGIFGIVTIGFCFLWKKKSPLIFMLFLIIGFGTTQMHMAEIPELYHAARNRQPAEVMGIVTDVSVSNAGRQKITVETNEVRLSQLSYDKKVKLYIIMPEGQQCALWDRVSFTGELLCLEKNTVPGAYNEWMYLKTRNYDFKMFPEQVEILGNEPVFFISGLRRLKTNVQEVYDTVFPKAQSGIIKAITTGDKDSIEDYTRSIYQKAGITHILAISGLHISALAMLMFWVLERTQIIGRRYAALLVICFLIVFAMFTGFAASTVRAVIMVSVGMLGIFLYRPGDSLNNIAIAGIGILLIQPLYLFDIGYQMSFTTVTGIILCVNVLSAYPGLPNWKKVLCVSVMATVTSYPVSAYYFQWISLVSVLANIVVIPMMTLLLAISMLTGVLGLFCIPVAVFTGGTAYCILQVFEFVSVTLSKLPASFVCIGSPSVLSILLWYGCVVAIYCYRPGKWYKKAVLGVLPILFLFSILGNRLVFKQNKLAFLDVGQGDAIVLTTYDKKAYVFDTGGWFWAETGDNTGGRIIKPYLEREGITEIEGLFISHMDSDHGDGALDLMEMMDVNGLYISDYDFEPGLLYAEILVTAKNQNIPVYQVHAGDKATLGEGIEITCLYPMKEKGLLFGDDNNGSMVLRLSIGEISVLLTGDASVEDEEWILEGDLAANATILKVGHHGSKYSSAAHFIETVSPELAIISCGADNTYGHPHQEVLSRLEDAQIKILRTDRDGTITIITNGDGYRVKTMMEAEDEGTKKTN